MFKRKILKEQKVPTKKLFRLLLKIALISTGLLLIYSSFLSIDLLKINYIYIHTDKEIDGKTIVLLSQKNIFLIDAGAIKESIIRENPDVEQVIVKKNFFGSLSIFITYRKPLAVAVNAILTENTYQPDASVSAEIKYGFERKDDNDYFIDLKGYLFKKNDESEFPIIGLDLQNKKTGDSMAEPKVLFMLSVLNTLHNSGESLSWVSSKENKVAVSLSDGSYVLFDSTKDLDYQLSSLQIIRNRFRIEGRKFEYLDLRFQKPVVKFLKE